MALLLTEILSRSEQGATLPFRCRGDDGELYFVKGRYAGSRAMCCEWVAGRLARLLGLPTPEIRIAEVPKELITGSSRPDAIDLGEGPVFASKMIVDARELVLPDVEHVPLEQQLLVLLFDWWVLNEDRTLTPFGGNPNLFWSTEAGGLRVFDQNLAFDDGFDLDRFWELHVFRAAAATGWSPGFRAATSEKLAKALSKLDEIWHELPHQWLDPGGEAASPAALERRVVEQTLGRFQTEPEFLDPLMNPRIPCNYAVLRFRPYQETGEFVNLGVVLLAHTVPFFDFRLEAQRHQRVTGFFPELDVPQFRLARAAFRRELVRVKSLLRDPEGALDAKERMGVFRELARPRESVFRFAEIGTVLADDPETQLDELFQRYVHRQFAKAVEYQEVVMARRLGEILLTEDLLKHYRRNAKVGNGTFHTRLAFVAEQTNAAGAPVRAIKPLDLDRVETTKIYDHGDAWIQRVKRLRQVGMAPERLLFTIRFPEGDETRLHAAREIVAELNRLEIQTAKEEDPQRVLEFARPSAG